ncbi:leucyl/phenylalanyl-tRNA--protein transferase [Thiomicrospira sp. R3]|uniref:leucyl/phenylalanyl-tRNA--protein transferase n=1 Tax=Thiomicrospira sp. R3 TaxID=3035472 RepID=UPI00259BEE92|nr:leucyl/phenylalanyl-tRNA--protein transferase [Thiomicrospira sp. R3]WFE68313.1 leucyl/phenylalanyl-tRNA--protein transferase [Thiomicrospira sp. R3]
MRSYPEHLPYWLDDPNTPCFPPTHFALDEPNGLLAVGVETLTPEWMLHAYQKGIFPWSGDEEQLTWWTPSPRAVLMTDQVNYSKSLQKTWRNTDLSISFDQAFMTVVKQCASIQRPGQNGTWIRKDMQTSLAHLHQLGHAHSVEVWHHQDLVGGLYGLSIGSMFFGESMFAQIANASKLALVALCRHLHQWGWPMIDCQMETDHLKSMGAITLSRDRFEALLHQQVNHTTNAPWLFDPDLMIPG